MCKKFSVFDKCKRIRIARSGTGWYWGLATDILRINDFNLYSVCRATATFLIMYSPWIKLIFHYTPVPKEGYIILHLSVRMSIRPAVRPMKFSRIFLRKYKSEPIWLHLSMLYRVMQFQIRYQSSTSCLPNTCIF